MLTALLLPFAAVWVDTTTVTWPAPGAAVTSSSAVFAPYRPTTLTATIPCTALRAAGPTAVVLETGTGADGLVVTADGMRFDGHRVAWDVRAGPAGCRAVLTAGHGRTSVLGPDGRRTDVAGPVPEVFGFHTGLKPAAAAGISVVATTVVPFGATPGVFKIALIVVQLVAAGWLLLRCGVRPRRRWIRWRPGWRRAWWVDLGVLATLGCWAVIGPLAVDDGWATTIARDVAATGDPGNYYRWWNAAEVPFAFSQELLAPWTAVSLAPLWLRLPSTLAAVGTWFLLSRGVLGAALPVRAATGRVRLLAAAFLLASWLPFNLGTRPESLVALGVTAVLALAMRTRDVRGLAAIALVVALTVSISPNGVLVAAPILVFGPRLLAAFRAGASGRLDLLARGCALAGVTAVGLTIIFANQTWDALDTATDWHVFFGPTLQWYDEPDRYRYLLQSDQQGSAPKRLPILLGVSMIPVVAAFGARRRDRDFVARSAIRLAAVVAVSLLLFAISPSKWSYQLGAAAGPLAALMTVGVVLVARRARRPDRYLVAAGAVAAVLLVAAVTLAFHGPNAWWLPAVYDVPWPAEPPRPLGIALDHPLPWIVAAAVVSAAVWRRGQRAVTGSPAAVALVAVGAVLALLLGSFVAAPLRRPQGSLAIVNLHRLHGVRPCGLAEDVQVLPDGPVLRTAGTDADQLSGFVAQGGYLPAAPPPDPVGTGVSIHLWGSRFPDERSTGSLTSAWFVLPPQPTTGGLALSVSGRTDGGNRLTFQFGRAAGRFVDDLGDVAPVDRPAVDENPAHPLWRTIGIDATEIPAGANRVRIHAVDGRTDPMGWLAVSGPRLRSTIPLTAFLATRGPVLVSWPMAFLFPCVHDIATVTGGVGTTPRAVIDSPRPHLTEDRKADVGGVFAALTTYGDLQEVPSRLRGHPDVDWGSVLVSADPARHDAYRRTVTRTLVPGLDGVPHPPPEH
ncbi:arabinosyltransferase domain-containing protein [Mycolicibacterium madagascariense]|uniref:arabinosyltransferase domain-containing protein n=1 Tax=Mycolicibacterium madagascariense TaxID=212765 RepID=UPI0021F2EC95|nr:arabinosyltransferase domain-containing protein [Mycolicibacterium madagascariense]MCV7014889.1 arabinosyltransferase domain-containing protein [Mycolicibacterium madagascariense]